MKLENASFEDVAFLICTAMHQAGTTAVLSGGGAATFYAPKAYQTRDLDFVLHFAIAAPSAQPILELGFSQTGTRGVYAHPDIIYTLEFLLGPLAVGDDTLESWNTFQRGGQILHVITAFDSVRDRMSAAIHWKDANSAQQAAVIARAQDVDIDAIRTWCLKEGGAKAFTLFEAYYGN